jgi:hypothetical protein
MGELKIPSDLERVLFVITHMMDALSHGAVLRPPPTDVAGRGEGRSSASDLGILARLTRPEESERSKKGIVVIWQKIDVF